MSDTPQRRVTVRSEGSGYRSSVTNSRDWQAYSDEPTSIGGDGKGFGPFELLAASLGTCTTATLLMYARRKQWPLESVVAELEYQRAGEQGLPTKGPDQLKRVIRLSGALQAEQVERLAGIATRCPVALALKGAELIIVDEISLESPAD